MRAYVDPIPTTVIAHILGIPTADWQQFKRCSDDVVEGLDPRAVRDQERIGSLSQRHPEFAAYLDEQVGQRHAAAEPPDDIITRFIQTEIDGVEIAANDAVVFGVGSANRDERCYAEPAAFRLDRPDPWDHVAFGAGPHICPGAALARLEATIALEVFSERVERLTLAPSYAFDPNPVFWAHGPRSLAVRIVVTQ